MRERLFQNTREVVYQVVIFATLIVYFSALFQMKLPSKAEHFAVIASTVFAMIVFTAILAAHDYFSRLNIRLFHIAKSIEQSILQNDHVECVESAIKEADSLSDYHVGPIGVILVIFFIETVASIYLAWLISNYLG